MNLNLKKPIVFFDLEATGLDVSKDRIVEISVLKVMPNGDQECKTRRINPEIPISPEAEAVHHISNEDVANEPTFKSIAKSLAKFLEGCDFAGYNSTKYDIPLLAEEFLRAGVDFDFRKHKMVDVQNIFHKMEQRTLSAAYKFYCHKDLDKAHSAEGDTVATYEVLLAQLEKYPTLENSIDYLSEFSTHTKFVDYAGRFIYDENKNIIVNFGKHKGKRLEEVFTKEPSYYDWIIRGDFTRDTKKIATDIYMKVHLK